MLDGSAFLRIKYLDVNIKQIDETHGRHSPPEKVTPPGSSP